MSCNLKNEVSCGNPDEIVEESRTGTQRGQMITVKGIRLFEEYNEHAESIENFEIRDDDIWVCSFPKSGTTWTQEMVWCIANDLDYDAAKVPLINRFPFFEIPISKNILEKEKTDKHEIYRTVALNGVKYFDGMPSPRFFKTHLPFHLLPRDLREGKKKAKIIHITRNPKDTCISYYYYSVNIGSFKGDFQQLSTLFLNDKLLYTPFWKHLSSYLNEANTMEKRILSLKYEDMQKDLASVIMKTSEFLGKPKLCTKDLIKLIEHLSFDKMKNSQALQYLSEGKLSENGELRNNREFFRCGKVNQWKNEMTPEIIKKFDDWSENNLKTLNIQDKMG